LGPVDANEVAKWGREADVSTHLTIIGYEEIGNSYATTLIAKNRLYAANAENQLAAETFEILAVQPFRWPGNTIATFEVLLRKVE
jgi:hypothetical protein